MGAASLADGSKSDQMNKNIQVELLTKMNQKHDITTMTTNMNSTFYKLKLSFRFPDLKVSVNI